MGTTLAQAQFPDFETVTYDYDRSGAQVGIRTLHGGVTEPIVSGLTRNARGQPVQVVYGNGARSVHAYNEAGDLRLRQLETFDPGNQKIQDYSYSFDAHGNVTGISDNVRPQLGAVYGYDSRDQLATMASPPGPSPTNYFAYDAAGNLTCLEGAVADCRNQSYGVAGHAHAVASDRAGTSYSYDANGNTSTTSAGLRVNWNADNMPTLVQHGNQVVAARWFTGEAVWKKLEGGVATYYLPHLRIEGPKARKFYDSFAERSAEDGRLRFYHNDNLGSSVLLTKQSSSDQDPNTGGNPDPNPWVSHRAAYMPYGGDRANAATGNFTPKYQFNFKEKDAAGLYDYGARLYSPVSGRFLSPDNVQTDGMNRYGYARNNPLNYADPTGHASLWSWIAEKYDQFDRYMKPAWACDGCGGFDKTFVGQMTIAYGHELIQERVGVNVPVLPEIANSAGYQTGIVANGAANIGLAFAAAESGTAGGAPAVAPAVQAQRGPARVPLGAATEFPVAKPNIMRALRQSGTIEGAAAAKLIKRGAVDLNVSYRTHIINGQAFRGTFDGDRTITVYAPHVESPLDAAGTVGHEVFHFLTRNTYIHPLMGEMKAETWHEMIVNKGQISPEEMLVRAAKFAFEMYPEFYLTDKIQ
jgi:RHS repeat-associated protein